MTSTGELAASSKSSGRESSPATSWRLLRSKSAPAKIQTEDQPEAAAGRDNFITRVGSRSTRPLRTHYAGPCSKRRDAIRRIRIYYRQSSHQSSSSRSFSRSPSSTAGGGWKKNASWAC
ncbi:hypothetical protein ABW21_db0203454 [Orbilia brochopaga]|nr:hypothetical protein ABW21_db0203454 [Drechslerella brochopaga]